MTAAAVAAAPLLGMTRIVRNARAALTDPDGTHRYGVGGHRHKNLRQILVTWTGQPHENTVTERLAVALAGQQVTVVMHRQRLWTCGTVHEDPLAAWTAHEGTEHLSWVTSCGQTDGCDHEDDDFWHCNDLDDEVLLDSTREMLAATGETFKSYCRPGEYARCPLCDGRGATRNRKTLVLVPCGWCDHKGVLDLDEAADRDLRVAAEAEAARLATEHARKETAAAVSRTRPISKKLP